MDRYCMREIKFRVWDKDNNRMLESYQMEPIIHIEIDEDWTFYDLLIGGTIMDNRFIIMQYTGLKDKNGKEIYEGDIISISRTTLNEKTATITEVYFGKGAFRWRHDDGSGSVLNFNNVSVKEGYESITQDVEVIGNIYENRNLLD